MEELAGVAEDPAEVVAGGEGEGAVPAQGREVVLGSSLIGELQKSLLLGRSVGRAVRLNHGGGRGDCEGCDNKEQKQRSGFALVMHAY